MGTIDFSKPITSTLNKNMKFFILAVLLVASVFAEPEAEADPNALYASYGYSGFPYYGYGAGLAYAGAYAPYTYAGYPYAYGYNGYALGATHLIGKRSADAEAEAKPDLGMVLMDMDMLDTHMLELMDTHMPELTPTELTHMPTELTLSARDPLMLKLSQKLGMVLMDMDMLHTATDMLDTHTVTPDTHTLMDTESRLVKILKNG